MKKKIVKMNNSKTWFFEKITELTNLQTDSSRTKERRIKPTKLEMKEDRLQQTMQKYKGLWETIMNNYVKKK